MKRIKQTVDALSVAHERYAASKHRNAYLTILWFALGSKDVYCYEGSVRFWWRVVAGRRC